MDSRTPAAGAIRQELLASKQIHRRIAIERNLGGVTLMRAARCPRPAWGLGTHRIPTCRTTGTSSCGRTARAGASSSTRSCSARRTTCTGNARSRSSRTARAGMREGRRRLPHPSSRRSGNRLVTACLPLDDATARPSRHCMASSVIARRTIAVARRRDDRVTAAPGSWPAQCAGARGSTSWRHRPGAGPYWARERRSDRRPGAARKIRPAN